MIRKDYLLSSIIAFFCTSLQVVPKLSTILNSRNRVFNLSYPILSGHTVNLISPLAGIMEERLFSLFLAPIALASPI